MILTLLVLGLAGTITGWVRATRLARVSELRRQFDTTLLRNNRPRSRLTIATTTELLEIVQQMTRFDARQAQASRAEALSAMSDSITERIAAQRLRTNDIDTLDAMIGELDQLDRARGRSLGQSRIDALKQALAARKRDWRLVLASGRPLSEADLAPFQDRVVRIREDALELEARRVGPRFFRPLTAAPTSRSRRRSREDSTAPVGWVSR